MKGVILSRCPEAQLVDLTHQLAPGNVRGGAFALWSAARYFLPGTVHLGVVDPGVGGERRPLVLRGAGALFVGPDNGLLWLAAAREGEPEAWEIDLSAWDRPISATFHGRDVFAPAAARLAAGEPPEAFCRPVTGIIRLDLPRPTVDDATVRGEVISVDRFGNAITNLTPADLGSPLDGQVEFMAAGHVIRGPASHYGAVPAGEPLVVLGSAGLYELAIHQGNAALRLRLGVGFPVEARLSARSHAGS